MSLTAGIVGLPNVGKSTLFNAITKAGAFVANYPFATIEPNVGVVEVHDKRLDDIVSIVHPKNVVPTTISFTDIAGLVKGASHGEGLGNQFLSHIRDVDAICHVVRCFDDNNITHVSGKIDPIDDIETVNMELILSDLDMVQKRLPKIEKKAMYKTDKDAVIEYDILKKLEDGFNHSIPARLLSLTDDEKAFIKNYQFLTMKPVLYVANVSESDIVEGNHYTKIVEEYAKKEGSEMVIISAAIEDELNGLEEADRKDYLESLGMEESGLENLVRKAYSLLGLCTFFTEGEKECRAWTFKRGMKAPQCAGIIHTDFEKGFIKAETYSYDDLMELGTPAKVKEAGRVRLEGKEYIVQDGDIVVFRFNL
jgi:GTP-binding protein YchF